ncbi:MAG: hypothetical protein AAF721_41650 [Myxococcota bacterium]
MSGCRDDDGGSEAAAGSTGTAGDSTGGAETTAADDAVADDDDTGSESGEPGTGDPPGPGTAQELYPDLVTLQAEGINPTCSLNNGVCHNGNNYPDLHTVNNVLATTWAPCGVEASDPELLFDECEPPGDHLVIQSQGVDLEILTVEVGPAGALTDDLESATLVVAGDVSGVEAGATDVTVTRGETVFDLGQHGTSVVSADGDTVELELIGQFGRWSARRFLDNRELPWNAGHVRVADPNGNGVAGAAAAIPIIAPGDPWGSYLFIRLLDEQYGDLMPRQCRTWDDRATRALGCWIEGLTTDDDGALDNALEPIDYDTCTVDVEGMGRCETIIGNDIEAMEGIFGARCGGSDCHLGDGVLGGGLDLSEGGLVDALVDVPSQSTDFTLVVPGDPDASYLLCKLDPSCPDINGAVMPSGADPLPPEELTAIRQWIAGGATDD